MSVSTQCIECAHYRLDLKCAAFPDGIPEAILTGRHDHTEPYPGDGGITFEPLSVPSRTRRPGRL